MAPTTPNPPIHFAAASRILADLTTPEPDPPASPEGDATASIDIPGYRILSRLGGGGGGEVFKAVRDGSDYPIAIKLLRTPLSDKSAADRAWRELDLLESLRLPALPRILDYGIASGRLYFATEFIDGLPIDEHCARGSPSLPSPMKPIAQAIESSPSVPPCLRASVPLSLPSRVSLLSRLALAVQSLHEHGVIHRDLKPSNILIDGSGNPVIIDLGIAALLESASGGPMATLTEAGAPIGTPAFMSPEQARGQRHLISTRSDVYSLGAVATLILTGRTPHDIGGPRSSRAPDGSPAGVLPSVPPCLRASVPSSIPLHEAIRRASVNPDRQGGARDQVPLHEAIRRAAEDEPLDPRTLDPTLPKPLAAILAKACARDPAHRYPSAADLAADLARWLKGDPVMAVPYGRWRKATRWAGRHPILTTAAACAVLVAGSVVGSLASVWFLRQRPFQMRLDPTQHQSADLVTMTGRVLRHWEGIGPSDLKFAALTENSAGRAIALSLLLNDEDPEQSGRLCAWDARHPDHPLWSTPRTPEEGLDPPPIPAGQTETWAGITRSFRANVALLADVFKDSAHPGDELVVNLIHYNQDPSALCVYALDGTLLYRAWHWGSVRTMLWLEQPRILIVQVCDNTAKWQELGVPTPDAANPYPNAVMAIQPVAGFGVDEPEGWLNTPAATTATRPMWYRYYSPPSLFEHFEPLARPIPGLPERDFAFEIDVRLLGNWDQVSGVPSITYEVDGAGALRRATINDGYPRIAAKRAEADSLPTLNEQAFWLSDTPGGGTAEGW